MGDQVGKNLGSAMAIWLHHNELGFKGRAALTGAIHEAKVFVSGWFRRSGRGRDPLQSIMYIALIYSNIIRLIINLGDLLFPFPK